MSLLSCSVQPVKPAIAGAGSYHVGVYMLKRSLLMTMMGLAMIAGCDEVHAPRAIGADKLAPGQYPRNVAVDEHLNEALVAGATIVNDGSKDQPMSVSQPVRNIKDFPLNIQYQFTFLDTSGKPIEGGGGWRYVTLEPRVERFLQGAALDTSAVDWRLTVRAAK